MKGRVPPQRAARAGHRKAARRRPREGPGRLGHDAQSIRYETSDSVQHMRRPPRTREVKVHGGTHSRVAPPTTPSPPDTRNGSSTNRYGRQRPGRRAPRCMTIKGQAVWVERTHLTAAACERAARVTAARRVGESTGWHRQAGDDKGVALGRAGGGRGGRGEKRAAARGGATTQATTAAGPRPTCARQHVGCRCRPCGGEGGGAGDVVPSRRRLPTTPWAEKLRGRTRRPGHSRHLHPPTHVYPTTQRSVRSAPPHHQHAGPAPRDSWTTVGGEIDANPGRLGGLIGSLVRCCGVTGGRLRDS